MLAMSVPLTARAFPQFGAQHFIILGVWLAGCVAAALLGRRLRGRRAERAFRWCLGAVLLAFAVPKQLGDLVASGWDIGTSLPFQLCDLAWMVGAWALFTCGWRSRSLLYFWGLTLTTQAILTPSLEQAWPDPLFVGFWGMHLVTVWAAVYLCIGLGLGPRWRGFAWSALCTAVWVAVMMAFNAAAGTNYGFVSHKPPEASLLDFLGPWPFYVLAEAAIAASVWALITWPWVMAGRRRTAAADRDAGRSARARQRTGR